MRLLLFIFSLLMISCVNPAKEKEEKPSEIFYVGTYTDQQSRGIYKYELSEQGKMKNLGLMTESENPSFLVKTIDGKFLLTVNEISNNQQEGSVESYKIVEDSLIFIDRKSSGGAHPCHISLNDEGFAVVSNYSGGNIALLSINEQGQIQEHDKHQHKGKGSTSRQEGPHAHSSYFYPNNNSIVSADLGTNELWFTSFDLDLKQLVSKKENLKIEGGIGPRHLCFHPNGKWLYVINELNGSITQVEYDGENYHTRSSISTLREDFDGENYSADIHISKDGKFVYASNRGPNEIAIFKVDPESGKLSLLSHQPSHGIWPRNFAFSTNEDFLLVAHQYSNNICCFKRDKESGLLTFVEEIEAPSPVCLLF